MCGLPGHFAQGCPHHEAFRRWHRDQANSKGVGESSPPALGSASSRPEVNVRVIGQIRNPQLKVGGPTSHWIGPEMLVTLTMKGRNFNALTDSGSQVNTITPALVQQYGFPVLPLEDLVDYPLNLMGLGRKCTSPLRFAILHVKCRVSQDMTKTRCSWWCLMSLISGRGFLWLWGPALSVE